MNPKLILLIGFILVLLGAVLPFLMVLHIIQANFFLVFFTFTSSTIGLFLGLIGAAGIVRRR